MATWRQMHWRAFQEARHALLIETGERLVLVIILAAVSIGLLWLVGNHEMAITELLIRAAATAAIVLSFPIVYVWKLVSFSAFGAWARRRLNTWLVITTIGALVMAAGIIGYAWDRARGPIIWNWDTYWAGGGMDANGPYKIGDFQFPGYNRWDDAIPIDNAYVRSEIDRTEVRLSARIKTGRFGYSDPPVKVIPARKEFILSGPVSADGHPMNPEEFRKTFSQFTFIFNSDVIKRFYEGDLANLYARAEADRPKE